MQEKRNEERKCHVVQQINRHVEVIAETDRFISMENKCHKTNGRKMKHERRVASLFEQHKDTDTEPNQTYKSKKNYIRRPTRETVDVFQVRKIVVVLERI